MPLDHTPEAIAAAAVEAAAKLVEQWPDIDSEHWWIRDACAKYIRDNRTAIVFDVTKPGESGIG